MAKQHNHALGLNARARLVQASGNNPKRHRNPGKLAMTTSRIALVLFSAALVFCHSVEIVSAKVIDAETGGECIDSDSVNCPFWAATGECQKNRGYMHSHCRKSCDRCHVVRVNDRSEIARKIEERRKDIEARRDEKRKQKEALKVLEGGSFGGAGSANENNGEKEIPPLKSEHESKLATSTISSTGTVETTISAANAELKNKEAAKEVSTNKPDSATAATATTQPLSSTSSSTKTGASTTTNEKPKRKKAKIDAQTGLECVDSHENCPFWAATGDCKTNRSFMSVNCRLSCDRCHIVRVQDANDIKKYIDRQQRATEGDRQARREARQVQQILAGEL